MRMRGEPSSTLMRRIRVSGRKVRPRLKKRGAKSALAVVQARAQDRGVGLVLLLAAHEVLQVHRPAAAGIARVEQRVEDRIAVEARQARPDDAAPRIDQRAVRAVADHAEIE
jgi:hypothetical protein